MSAIEANNDTDRANSEKLELTIVTEKKEELENAMQNGFVQLDRIVKEKGTFAIGNTVNSRNVEFKYSHYDLKSERLVIDINGKKRIGVHAPSEFVADTDKNIITGKYFYSSPFVLFKTNENDIIFEKDNTLVNFKNVPDIDKLSDVWFPRNKEKRELNAEKRSFYVNTPKDKEHLESFDYFIKQAWPMYESGVWKSVPPSPYRPDTPKKESKWELDWALWFIAIGLWRLLVFKTYNKTIYKSHVCVIDNKENTVEIGEDELSLPPIEDYIPSRPINLNPDEVQNKIEKSGFKVRRAIIESACSTLNSGKNIIFAGPPGCGKSELAQKLSKIAGINSLSVTASPGWTTDELLGRYMPIKESGKGVLEYVPGYFIKAIEESKWLIIDEINRADIDSCFGELFSVLAGQPALLPYRVSANEDNEIAGEKSNDTEIENKQIVIIPAKKKSDIIETSSEENYETYPEEQYKKIQVSNSFRLIGTMNDFDASRLNQLSYAFMRRFNIIHVDAPTVEDMRNIIEGHIDKFVKNLTDYNLVLYPKYGGNENQSNEKESIKERARNLFANQEKIDLIQGNIIGVSSALDVLNIGIEGISYDNSRGKTAKSKLKNEQYEELICSYLAMGVAMNVFPQLDAYATFQEKDKEIIKSSIQTILEGITQLQGKPLYMVTITLNGNKYETEEYPKIETQWTIKEYLKKEFNRRFRNADSMNVEELFSI